jgi:nucleotide-binding universal stress UspA family protein
MPKVNPIKYLVCMTPSDHSRVMLKFACLRAQKRGSRITLLHVVESSDLQGMLAVVEQLREERRTEAKAFMDEAAAYVKQVTGRPATVIIKEGNVEEQIIHTAQEDIDLNMIMIGVSGNQQKRTVQVGNLVRALGEKLFVPLLIIPGALTDQQIEQLS